MDSMDTAMPSGEYPAEEKQPSGGEIASADGDSTSESIWRWESMMRFMTECSETRRLLALKILYDRIRSQMSAE